MPVRIDKKGKGRHAEVSPLPIKQEESMKIRMLETKKGSPDGIRINEYEIGKKYDIPKSLAEAFLRAGWAEEDKILDVPKEIKKYKREKK